MRRVPPAGDLRDRARVRAQPACPQECQLPGLPPTCRRTRSDGASRLHDRKSLTSKNLQRVSRRAVRAVRAQSARGSIVGRGARNQGLLGTANCRGRALPQGMGKACAQRGWRARGARRASERLRSLSQHRQAQCRRLLRHLHQLPRQAQRIGGARAAAHHLRAMPHGSGPQSARDLRRVQARRVVRRPAST